MIKILLLSGFDITAAQANANSICVAKIIEAMQEYKDITLDIACNGVVERTPVGNWKRNPLYMLRRIKRWPSYNPDVETACRKELFEILSENEYDCLFVPHKPFETVYAACMAKRYFPKLKLYIYALDPIANEIDANNGIGKHLFFLSQIAEKRVFQTADHVFHMECNRKKYSGKEYERYAEKFSFLDFPLIEHKDFSAYSGDDYNNTKKVTIIYSGSLDDTYRSPNYLLNVYELVSRKLNVELHFYAKGNSVKKIESICNKNQAVKSFGYVSQDELAKKIEEADYLINIGNKFSDMLPSKLLMYFMTGKPIIHIKNQRNDICTQYLERYPLSVIVDENDSVEASANKIIDFITKNYHRRISSDSIEKIFEYNTPKWNAEQIRNILLGNVKDVS